MRVLELRRHAPREPGSVHLSTLGREQARQLGVRLGRFDRVLSSPKPRALETVAEFGRTVDRVLPGLGEVPEEVGARIDEVAPRTFEAYVSLVERSELIQRFAREEADLWRSELVQLMEGGSLLIVSHGGLIELGAAAALPRSARGWGPAVAPLEGVRLVMEGGDWKEGAVLRLPAGTGRPATGASPAT